jgi:proteasome lid subunit RPN8/RPN11
MDANLLNWKINKIVLESIMEFSKNFYPLEFSGLLYCDIDKRIITDIYILPGTHSGRTSAVLRMDLAPMTFNLAGSVHSHPSGQGDASNADLNFFSGKQINIIAYPPFSLDSYKAYNKQGVLVKIDVITQEKNEI